MRRLLIIALVLLLVPAGLAAAQTTTATGTVTAYWLNVRTAPTVDADIIARLPRGYTAGVTGRNADASWYQILIPGGSGWVSGAYLSVTNAHTVPVVGAPTAQVTGYIDTGALNVRSVPSPYNNDPIATFYRGTTVDIIGRNADSSWYQVQVGYGPVTGWVNGRYITITNGNINGVPVTSNTTPTPPPVQDYASGYVNTGALNIRPVPRWWGNTPLTFIYRNTTVDIIGRNADASWYLVELPNGTTGWARSRYITVTTGSANNAPVVG